MPESYKQIFTLPLFAGGGCYRIPDPSEAVRQSSYLCRMAKMVQKNIRHLSLPEIEEYFETIGEKKFRANQVYEWLWLKPVQSFDAMTNLSKELRAKLNEHFHLPALQIETTQYSEDGTVKSRFKTADGHLVEGVLIPADDRQTACVSSQIGCSLKIGRAHV